MAHFLFYYKICKHEKEIDYTLSLFIDGMLVLYLVE